MKKVSGVIALILILCILTASVPAMAATKVYASTNYIKIYSNYSTSSSVIAYMGYGESLYLLDYNSTWAKLSSASGKVGYAKVSGLTTSNPNKYSIGAYVQSDGAKAYEKPSTDADVMTSLDTNTKVTVVAITPDGAWCRVTRSGVYGYMRTKDLDTDKVAEKNYVECDMTVYAKSDVLPIYASCSTSAKVLAYVGYGEKLEVGAYDATWALVGYNGVVGVCKISGLSTSNLNKYGITAYAKSDNTKAYTKPSTSASSAGTINKNTEVTVIAINSEGDWCRVERDGNYGYIKTSALTTTISADVSNSNSNSSTADKLIGYAKEHLGKTYVYGTAGPNTFDCSGFTQYCYKKVAGVSLSRSAYSQGYTSSYTKITSISDLKKGDLVCFNTVEGDSDLSDHVGIYMGGGQFIHASSSGGKVMISTLSSGYYNRVFSWGFRVL